MLMAIVVSDFIVGAQGTSGPLGAHVGSAYVFAGGTGQLIWDWSGEGASDVFGHAVAGIRDVNGDGKPDALIGAYSHDGPGGWNSGKAYVFSGSTGNLLWSWTGDGYLDLFGSYVGAAADTDGDGRSEILVSAVYHDGPGGNDSGRAYLFRPVSYADCDCDGVIRVSDHSGFTYCLAGAGAPMRSPPCNCADLDGDEDVDIRDFEKFQLIDLTGP